MCSAALCLCIQRVGKRGDEDLEEEACRGEARVILCMVGAPTRHKLATEASDSEGKVASAFATEFQYSRFDADRAAPRDLSTLKGRRIPLVAGASAGAGAVLESDGLSCVACSMRLEAGS